MRVLLTGATGFIGSHIAHLLVRQGCEVYALVREGTEPVSIADLRPRLRIIRGDLHAIDRLEERLLRIAPTLCIHAAWSEVSSRAADDPAHARLVAASADLAIRLARIGCPRFVGLGTCFEYETSLGYLSERSATEPSTIYGASKLATYLLLSRLAPVLGMSVAWPRLFYVYGPREPEHRLVPSVIRSLLRNEQAGVTPGEHLLSQLAVGDRAGR